MQKAVFLAALLTSAIAFWGGGATAADPRYALTCKSLWTKLNDAPLSIQVEPISDIFWIDTAKNTINDAPGEFTDTEISWVSGVGKGTARTTHLADKATGKYTVRIYSTNPITGTAATSEYDGQCEPYVPSL